MDKHYDLTTSAGYLAARRALGIYVSPYLFVYKLVKKFFSPEESNARQAEVAQELIRRGKENGVKHLEIECDAENWAGFDVPIEGANIKVGGLGKGKIKIVADYK